MRSASLLPRLCRSCGGPVARTGPGRHPATCSPTCRRAYRAAAARARRRAAKTLATLQPTGGERHAATDELAADAARTRQRLRGRDAERVARRTDLESSLATVADFYPSETDDAAPPTLGDLGLTRVGPSHGSHGRATVWESDGSRASRSRQAEREAADIRRGCLEEAVRAARISARARGVFVLEDADIVAAERAAEARAEAILAAL